MPKFKRLEELGKEFNNPFFLVEHGGHVMYNSRTVINELRTALSKVRVGHYHEFGRKVGLAIKDLLGYLDQNKVKKRNVVNIQP